MTASDTRLRRQFLAITSCAGVLMTLGAAICPAGEGRMERSFWVHASLGLFTQRNYFGPDFSSTQMPSREQVHRASRMLTDSGAANRLYLIYHRELPVEEARRLFTWWKEAAPADVEIVPALVLRMYDKAQTPVFSVDELSALVEFLHDNVNGDHIGIYDIASRREAADAVNALVRMFPDGLIRLGLQPDEALASPFSAAVADTWSALCHGTRNDEDWRQPGFGADTLRKWVRARNAGTAPVAWNLVTVAWDYKVTGRGGYPGYDDAEKNMPLPAGRNRAGLELVCETADKKRLAGFSSDLYILHENSRTAVHDGRDGSFYECLKRGEDYQGFYGVPFQEIAALYRELRVRGE